MSESPAQERLLGEARQLNLLISEQDPVLILVERLERIFRPALDENLPANLAGQLTTALEEDADFARALAGRVGQALLEDEALLAAFTERLAEAARPGPDFVGLVANQVAAALQAQVPQEAPGSSKDDSPRETPTIQAPSPADASPHPPNVPTPPRTERPAVGQVLLAATGERAERLSDALEPLGRPLVTITAIVVALLAGAGFAYLSVFFF